MVRVLKLRIGEEVEFVDGAGKRVQAEVVRYTEREVAVSLKRGSSTLGVVSSSVASARLFVCSAILKQDHFEWLTEKLAEIGVSDLLPLVSARTIKKDVRLERLQALAQEAMEQSEQAVCMRVHAPQDVMGAARFLERQTMKALVCDTGAGLKRFDEAIANTSVHAVFIGPEGGWTEEERAFFEKECGYTRVSLGPSFLRGETAGILAGYMLRRTRGHV